MADDDKPARRRGAAGADAPSKTDVLEYVAKLGDAFRKLLDDLGASVETVAARAKLAEAEFHVHRHLSIVPETAPAAAEGE